MTFDCRYEPTTTAIRGERQRLLVRRSRRYGARHLRQQFFGAWWTQRKSLRHTFRFNQKCHQRRWGQRNDHRLSRLICVYDFRQNVRSRLCSISIETSPQQPWVYAFRHICRSAGNGTAETALRWASRSRRITEKSRSKYRNCWCFSFCYCWMRFLLN